MHTIDPDMVVFGGGMIAAGERFLERIRHHVRELAFPVPAANTADPLRRTRQRRRLHRRRRLRAATYPWDW